MAVVKQAAGPEPGLRNLLAGLGAGLVAGAFVWVVFLGMTGQFGAVLKGIRLAPAPDSAPSDDVARWGVAVAATLGILAATLVWRPRRPAMGAVAAGILLVLSGALGLVLRDLVTWALIALPMTVPAAALVLIHVGRARNEHWRPFADPLPQLAAAARLGAVYTVVVGMLVTRG